MEKRASEELERRSRYLSNLILVQQKRKKKGEGEKRSEIRDEDVEEIRGGRKEEQEPKGRWCMEAIIRDLNREARREGEEEEKKGKGEDRRATVIAAAAAADGFRVRASDMSPLMQRRAFHCAREALSSMTKLDSKRLALTLKKEFDSSFGSTWHCIVGKSFGSYVTHSVGGFLYFSVDDKVHILLFRTAVEPLN